MKKTITLSEEKLRNFISYSVARLLKEYRALDDLEGYYDNEDNEAEDDKDKEKPRNLATTVHFPPKQDKENKKDEKKGKEEKDEPAAVNENKIRLSESEIKRIIAKAVKKRLNESFDSLGQSLYSARIDQEGDFAKEIYNVMGDIGNEMSDIEKEMNNADDFDDRNTINYYETLKRAYESLEDLVHFCNSDY